VVHCPGHAVTLVEGLVHWLVAEPAVGLLPVHLVLGPLPRSAASASAPDGGVVGVGALGVAWCAVGLVWCGLVTWLVPQRAYPRHGPQVFDPHALNRVPPFRMGGGVVRTLPVLR
jgi:hypothetical protein